MGARSLPSAVLTALSDEQVESFHRDGFLIVDEGFISDAAIEALPERFERLFAGEYATGIQPDDVYWKAGRDPEDRTRQICSRPGRVRSACTRTGPTPT
jgi:hypothetical protein